MCLCVGGGGQIFPGKCTKMRGGRSITMEISIALCIAHKYHSLYFVSQSKIVPMFFMFDLVPHFCCVDNIVCI